MNLPIEILQYIFTFLTIKDIFKFKFLSRRANSLFFSLGKKFGVGFLIESSKKIINPKVYYNCQKYFFVNELVNELRDRFSFTDLLFIQHSLENFLRMATISNTLQHLFYCKRSFFAKSDCKYCSRLYVTNSQLPNFFPNLTILNRNEIISEKKYYFNFLWENNEQKDIINSNMVRCLDTVVIQDHIDFLVYFIEIQARYYCNFFICLSRFLQVERSEKNFLLEYSSKLFDCYLSYILKHVDLDAFKNIFDEIDINQFQYFKVINRKYKEYLKRKYES